LPEIEGWWPVVEEKFGRVERKRRRNLYTRWHREYYETWWEGKSVLKNVGRNF
jgi:hypothetical protein